MGCTIASAVGPCIAEAAQRCPPPDARARGAVMPRIARRPSRPDAGALRLERAQCQAGREQDTEGHLQPAGLAEAEDEVAALLTGADPAER